jgi:hypothetical protein
MIRLETYRGYTYTIEWWGSFDYTSHVFNGCETLMQTYIDNSLESAVRRVQYALDQWPFNRNVDDQS